MEANGWTVRFRETNLPHAAVLATVEDMAADALCISATIMANLLSVADLIRTVSSKMKDRTPRILLGGLAFTLLPTFPVDNVNPEVVADLRQGLALDCGKV